jgi:hypothetical protein
LLPRADHVAATISCIGEESFLRLRMKSGRKIGRSDSFCSGPAAVEQHAERQMLQPGNTLREFKR